MATHLRFPSLKTLTVVSLLFAALVAVSSGFSFLFDGLTLWIWAGALFFLLLILFAYLLYGYGRLARLAIRKEENGSSFAQAFKTNPMLRKMIASGAGRSPLRTSLASRDDRAHRPPFCPRKENATVYWTAAGLAAPR